MTFAIFQISNFFTTSPYRKDEKNGNQYFSGGIKRIKPTMVLFEKVIRQLNLLNVHHNNDNRLILLLVSRI